MCGVGEENCVFGCFCIHVCVCVCLCFHMYMCPCVCVLMCSCVHVFTWSHAHLAQAVLVPCRVGARQEEKSVFRGHNAGVVDLAYSDDYRFLLSAGIDH